MRYLSRQFKSKVPIVALLTAASLPATVSAFEAGSWIVRGGISIVAPDASGDQLTLNGSAAGFVSAVGVEKLDVDDDEQIGLTFEYMLDANWGVEVLASTPFSHTASATGTLSGLDIADIKHLPPTLSAVYHFNAGEDFRPYIGAGINYTLFFDEDTTSAADDTFATLGLIGGDVELDDSWGLALQFGADYKIGNNWWLNGSVRWIDISTTAEITFDDGSKVSGDVDIDPFVYSIKLGYAF